MSQTDLADETGFDPSHFNRLESGRRGGMKAATATIAADKLKITDPQDRLPFLLSAAGHSDEAIVTLIADFTNQVVIESMSENEVTIIGGQPFLPESQEDQTISCIRRINLPNNGS